MYDRETGSLWSHILGEAMRGKLKGTTLEIIPSAITDWKSWKAKHPKTTVVMLSRTSRQFKTDFYRNPGRFVIGFVVGGDARAWGFDVLQKSPVINDRFGKQSLLVTFDAKSSAPYLFGREVDGKTLEFAFRERKLVDGGTGSEWDLTTGRAVSGAMKGKQLKPLPGVISFRKAWEKFHPSSSYAKPAAQKKQTGR